MDNQKIPTWVGTVIIIIVAITVGVFVWKVETKQNKNQVSNANLKPDLVDNLQRQNNHPQQSQLSDQQIAELMKNPKVYTDKKNGIEFQYPKNYSISSQPNNLNAYTIKDESTKDGSNIIAGIEITKWKGAIIQKGTPATEYENIAYANWKYIIDNFNNIQNGNCDSNLIAAVPGPTIADKPTVCVVDNEANYIKIETDSSVIYYTIDGREIFWGGSPQNINIIKEITATFKFL